jgi:hypothetical protein
MKTKSLIFMIFGCLAFLMMACSQFEMTDDDQDNAQLKKKSVVPVFIVEPGGGDDTPAIMQAFMDAEAAGPGSVVQLVEGEYHLGFIEIRDFYGSFRGAGKDKTIITAMDNLAALDMIALGQYPQLIKFVGGDVHISDFTLRTPEGAISDMPYGHIQCLMSFSAYNANYELGNEERSINAVVDNVSFHGQFYEAGMGFYHYAYNCLLAVRAGYDFTGYEELPREHINFKITNSDFNTFCYGLVLEAMKESELIVGEKNNGNVFNVCEQGGGVWESRRMNILIEGNIFNVPEACWGFDVNDYPYYEQYGILKYEPETKTTVCNINTNVFNVNHSEYAIWLRNMRHYDFEGEMPTAYQLKNNKFNMADYYDWAFIGRGIKGTVIRNNQFVGLGDLAVYLDMGASEGLILGNNFSSVDLLSGSIYLNSTTWNWTIVGGGDNQSMVLNGGTNNIITGVNVSTSEIPLGKRISEKLPPMNHLMH